MITSDQVRDRVYAVIMKEPLDKKWIKIREDSNGNKEYYGELFPEGFHGWITIVFQFYSSLSFIITVETPDGGCQINLSRDQGLNFMYKLSEYIKSLIKVEHTEEEEKKQDIYAHILNYIDNIEGTDEGHNDR